MPPCICRPMQLSSCTPLCPPHPTPPHPTPPQNPTHTCDSLYVFFICMIVTGSEARRTPTVVSAMLSHHGSPVPSRTDSNANCSVRVGKSHLPSAAASRAAASAAAATSITTDALKASSKGLAAAADVTASGAAGTSRSEGNVPASSSPLPSSGWGAAVPREKRLKWRTGMQSC
jgi:hypothetical protein